MVVAITLKQVTPSAPPNDTDLCLLSAGLITQHQNIETLNFHKKYFYDSQRVLFCFRFRLQDTPHHLKTEVWNPDMKLIFSEPLHCQDDNALIFVRIAPEDPP